MKMAICLTWGRADDSKCARCSSARLSTEARARPLEMTSLLRLLQLPTFTGKLIALDVGESHYPFLHFLDKIPLALHAAQHITWEVCSTEDIQSFIEVALGLLQNVDSKTVVLLRQVFHTFQWCTTQSEHIAR